METSSSNINLEYYERKIWNLKSLIEISLLINSKLNIDNILDIIAFTSMGELMSETVCIFLPKIFGDFDFQLTKYKGPHSITLENDKYSIKSNNKIIDFFIKKPHPIYYDELDNEIKKDLSGIFIFNPVILSPLIIKTELNGVLLLGLKLNGEKYTKEEIEYIDILSHISSIAIDNARLYEDATYDFRTGLYLFKNFKIRSQKEFSRAMRFGLTFSIIMIDIDFFKKINDTYGHNAGDIVLSYFGKIIRESIREIDIASRFGGEEFIILCPETKKENALFLANRLQKLIREYSFPVGENSLKLTASFGISELDKEIDKSFDNILERADKALYSSKQNGRDQITIL